MANKNWTGERLETFLFNESAIEHLHRYAIAREFVKDKTVLDIACGEGYGTSLLAAEAKTVLGVDANEDTIKKAKEKYTSPNIKFVHGSAEKIPAPDQSFDTVVSFETLEHLTDHDGMLQEIKRVLKPGGLLIMSTPDKKYYSDLPGYNNPFHKKELYEGEFRNLIARYFKYSYFIYQKLSLASLALLREENRVVQYNGDYEKIESQSSPDHVYLVAIASDSDISKPASSIFTGNAILQTALEEKERSLKTTLSYRIGHFILYPAKLIRNVFKK